MNVCNIEITRVTMVVQVPISVFPSFLHYAHVCIYVKAIHKREIQLLVYMEMLT